MPVGLFAGAEDDEVVHVVPFLKQHCGGQGGAEGGEFFGVEEGAGVAVAVEECE